MKFSNFVIGILNFLTLFPSIAILYLGLLLHEQTQTECERWLEKLIIALGIFLLVVSLMGFIGAFCRVSWFLWFYLFAMFLLIILIFIFTIFTGVGVHSNWLQNKVNNNNNWNTIKSCLLSDHFCDFDNQYLNDDSKSHLSGLKFGCCKPSNDCGFTKKTQTVTFTEPRCDDPNDCIYNYNHTTWTKTENVTYTNPDCDAWNNDPNVMCFNCQSCKNGFLQDLQDGRNINWKKVSYVNIIFLTFLVIVCSFNCCAIRNNKSRGRNKSGRTKL